MSRVCAFARSRLWFVCVCLLPYGNITNYNGTSFTYNAANEITNSGYTYDGSGQETAGGGFSYAYNQANQATSITQNGQAQAIDYADAFYRATRAYAQNKTLPPFESVISR